MLRVLRFSRSRPRAVGTSSNAYPRGGRSSPAPALRSYSVSPLRSVQTDYSDPYFRSLPSPAVDRRYYIPSPPSSRFRARAYEPAKRVSGSPARVVAPPPRKRVQGRSKPLPMSSWKGLLFSAPASVQVCVQRKTRKEVMHALGKAGKPTRAPRRGPFSHVRCR